MFLWVHVSLPNNKLLENLENATFFQVNVVFHFPLWDACIVRNISPIVAGILCWDICLQKNKLKDPRAVFPKTGKAGKQSDKREKASFIAMKQLKDMARNSLLHWDSSVNVHFSPDAC